MTMTQKPNKLEQELEQYLQLTQCKEARCPCKSTMQRHCPFTAGHSNGDKNPSLTLKIEADAFIMAKCWSAHVNMRPSVIVNKLKEQLLIEGTAQEAPAPTPLELPLDSYTPSVKETESASGAIEKLTVEEYLKERNLSKEVAEAFQLTDTKAGIRMPYKDRSKVLVATKYRFNNEKKFKKGDKSNHPYGLNLLETYRNTINIVEGESDTHALWDNRLDAGAVLGSGGNNHKIDEWDTSIWEEFSVIKLWIDNGYKGYQALDAGAKALIEAGLRLPQEHKEKIRIAILPSPIKDVSEAVATNDPKIIQGVKSYTIHEYINEPLLEELKELVELQDKNVVNHLGNKFTKAGLQKDIALMIFMTIESSLSDNPNSLVVKGESSIGKNLHCKSTFGYFPQDILVEATSMSPKALVYDERDFKNKILYKAETTGAEDKEYQMMERNLLSEGKIIHSTVIDGKSLLIEKEGPTGLLTTTTRAGLYHDNETRVLQITMPNNKSYLNKVIGTVAESYVNPKRFVSVKDKTFIALYEYNKKMKWEVQIPFADAIASLWGIIAPEQIRDFRQLMELIKSSARLNFMHRETEEVEGTNVLVADVADYENVRVIANQMFSESIGKVIPKSCTETFNILKDLAKNSTEYFTSKNIEDAGRNKETGEPHKHYTTINDDLKRLYKLKFIEQEPTTNWSKRVLVRPTQTTEVVYRDILPSLMDIAEYRNIGNNGMVLTDTTELDKLYPPAEVEPATDSDEFTN